MTPTTPGKEKYTQFSCPNPQPVLCLIILVKATSLIVLGRGKISTSSVWYVVFSEEDFLIVKAH